MALYIKGLVELLKSKLVRLEFDYRSNKTTHSFTLIFIAPSTGLLIKVVSYLQTVPVEILPSKETLVEGIIKIIKSLLECNAVILAGIGIPPQVPAATVKARASALIV